MTIADFRRKRERSADFSPADSENLYELWVRCRRDAIRRLPRDLSFTVSEVHAAELWSSIQRAWGLEVRTHLTENGEARAFEVMGPDRVTPHCILYPATTGVQTDDFSGESRVYPSLQAALQAIAPIS